MANCAWCHKKTNLPAVFAAETPLMEWMEERIDKWCDNNNITRDALWGGESDWNKINLSPEMEMELLAYDELVASVSKKTICKECLIEDDKVYKKYYLDMDGDITFTLDDLE
jgi:hypothetical protein|tara:strand:+ start:771 stop:1106 length:336 start_codon:yes stop_codon:yes gene_type:complete